MQRVTAVMVGLALAAFAQMGLISEGLKASEKENGAAEHIAAQKGGAPTIDVTIATGAAGDDDLTQGVYIFHLKCAGSCQLDRITLNQCSKNEHGDAVFAPKVDEWSTATNMMSFEQISKNQIRLTVYQDFARLLPAQMTMTFNTLDQPFTGLADLKTAGFLDFRAFPGQRPTKIEYVPLAHDRLKALNCPALLPGMDHSKP